MITEFLKYKNFKSTITYKHGGGSVCPICETNVIASDISTTKDKDNNYTNFICRFCGFEWYSKYKIIRRTKISEYAQYVASYSKKNNKRIVVGSTPPKNSFDELKIVANKYNL